MTKYLKILKNSDIFPKSKIKKPEKYKERQTVKAIVQNKKEQVALVTNYIHNLYTLPGGKAEKVNLKLEMMRECLEEINHEVKILRTIGKIKEFRDRDEKIYITTCFVAKTIKKVRGDFRTEKEIENSLSVIWVSKKKLKNIFETQNKKVAAGKINFYNTAFNIVRDKIFIDEWLKNNP